MKLSFSTLGCPEWSFEKVMDEACRMGYSGIEIRGIQGEMRIDRMDFCQPGCRQDTLRSMKEHGLAFCGFGSSISFHEPEKRADAMEEGRTAIDVCAAMGLPYIRVFGDRIPEGRSIDEATDLAADGIEELCAYAKDTDVGIILETHGNFNTLETISSLLSKISASNFGILWDIAHSDRVYGDDYLPFYQLVRPFLKHVHIKDHYRQPDGTTQLCSTGKGDIPIRAIVNTILDGGYDGYFSLEWEKKWHPDLSAPETEFPHYIEYMQG